MRTHDSQQYVLSVEKKQRSHLAKQFMHSTIRGKWSDQETIAYFNFLIMQRKDFDKPGERKRNHIFLKMSKFLGTRSPDQCRSHHQKIQNYAQTKQIGALCSYLLEKLQNSPNYSELRMNLQRSEKSIQTGIMEEGLEIRKQNYLINGNERGSFIVVVELDSLIKW